MVHLKPKRLILSVLSALVLGAALFGFQPSASYAQTIQFTKHGPNCYNSALYSSEVLSSYRFVSPRELHVLLNNPNLCKRIENSEVQRGDLRIYMRNIPNLIEEDLYVHANIYNDATHSLNKMTLFMTSQPVIQSESETEKNYNTTFHGIWLTNKSGQRFKCTDYDCSNRTEFYRCENLHRHFLQNYNEPYLKIFPTYLKLTDAIHMHVLDHPKSENEEAEITALYSNFNSALNEQCRNKNDFMCTYLKELSASIRTQLSMTQPNNQWIENYVATKVAETAKSRVREIMSHGVFIPKTFKTCGEELYFYGLHNIHYRDNSFVLHHRTTPHNNQLFDRIANIESYDFAKDCSAVNFTFKDNSPDRQFEPPFPPSTFPLTFKEQKHESAIHKGEFKLTTLTVTTDHGTVQPFKGKIGRYQIVGENSGGVYVYKENFFEKSLHHFSPSTNKTELMTRLSPKVDAQLKAFNIPIPNSPHSLPAFYAKAKFSRGLVIYVHGGGCWLKNSHVEPTLFFPESVDMLNSGYDVMLVSYSGDQGKNIPEIKNCGVDEVKDLLTNIHFAKTELKAKKIFLMGDSYGAYLINLLIGKHPDTEIAGAITKSGIWSFEQQRQIDRNLEKRIVPTKENDPAHFIHRIKTPILMFHGQKDDAVAFGNATFFLLKAERLNLNRTSFTPAKIGHSLPYTHTLNIEEVETWHNMLLDFLKSQ